MPADGDATAASAALDPRPVTSADPWTVAHSYESHGRLPPFTEFGADVAQPGVLRRVVSQVAYQGEIILLCGDGSAYASPTALNTVMQFYALRLRHVLFVSDSRQSCEALRRGLPSLRCVYTSRVPRTKPQNGGGCVKRFWDMRFYFYDVRKHLLMLLAVEHGLNVLQSDTDVSWFANPYPRLKAGENARAGIIAQWDAPFVNAGVLYVQHVQRDDAAAWVLTELHRRIDEFMHHPEAVPRYVRWALPPYFSNSDEQTLLNDVLISAMTNTSCYIWSTAYFEAKYGGAGRGRSFAGWPSTPEGRLQPRLKAQAEGSKIPGTTLHRLVSPRGGLPSAFKRAPSALFSHYLHLMKDFVADPARHAHGHRFASRQAAVRMQAVAAAAATEGRPASFSTLSVMPSVMVHLAGIRTGAWARRALMRAHGWWHPESDRLAAIELGWGRRAGLLRASESGVVAAASRSHIDVLMGNMMLLGLLTDRTPVVPETRCTFAPTPRSCADGCAVDSTRTAPRLSDSGAESLRCGWVAPKRCWRTEMVTELEFERRQLYSQASRSQAEAQQPRQPPPPQQQQQQPSQRGGRAPQSRGAAATARRLGFSAVQAERPGLAERRACTSDADWLVGATIGRWPAERFHASVAEAAPHSASREKARRPVRAAKARAREPHVATSAAQHEGLQNTSATRNGTGSLVANQTRRALARIIHSLACAPAGGVFSMLHGASSPSADAAEDESEAAAEDGVAATSRSRLETRRALAVLMREPLVSPSAPLPLINGSWSSVAQSRAHMLRRGRYDDAVSRLIYAAARRPRLGIGARRAMAIDANRSAARLSSQWAAMSLLRTESVMAMPRIRSAFREDIACISGLLTPEHQATGLEAAHQIGRAPTHTRVIAGPRAAAGTAPGATAGGRGSGGGVKGKAAKGKLQIVAGVSRSAPKLGAKGKPIEAARRHMITSRGSEKSDSESQSHVVSETETG